MKNKKIIWISLCIFCFVIGFATAQTIQEKRAELYQNFGPKLIDAVVQVTADEINILRIEAGLPERTNEQIIDAISTKLDSIENYDWMNITI